MYFKYIFYILLLRFILNLFLNNIHYNQRVFFTFSCYIHLTIWNAYMWKYVFHEQVIHTNMLGNWKASELQTQVSLSILVWKPAFKIWCLGADEMAQWARYPAPTWGLTVICNSSSGEYDTLFCEQALHACHVVHRHMHRQNNYTHKIEIIFLNVIKCT